MDNEDVLLNLVRVGTVRAIDATKRKARVWYDDLAITSGWLCVLQHRGALAGTAAAGWMPGVGARVLVLYLPVFNGDGFILGGL